MARKLQTRVTYQIKATPLLVKNLQGLVEFHTLHPNAPLQAYDLELIKAALAAIMLPDEGHGNWHGHSTDDPRI